MGLEMEEASEREPGSTSTGGGELAEAQRVRQQAVHMAERMLREVMGSSGDTVGGLETWQDAAMLRALAEEEMAFAQEEAKRLPAMARAERDEMRAKYAEERKALRRELQDELEASRAAVADEAEGIRRAAESEAARVLTEAKGKAEQARQDVTQDLHRAERRLAVLRTALADAESRFRRLAATAANEAGTLTALADQDVLPSEPAPPPRVMVDLTEEEIQAAARLSANTGFRADEAAAETDASTAASDDDPLSRNREEGFYQRRLAGLRDRLEKSGHPPE